MGGAIGRGQRHAGGRVQHLGRPGGGQRVFSSGLDVTMVGLDVTHKALLTQAEVTSSSTRTVRPAARDAPAGSSPTCTASTHEHHRRRYGWDGAPVHDAVAVAHVIDGTLLETKHCGVLVDTGSELSRGRTYVDLWGVAGWEPNCHVAVDIESDRFLELLIERITSLG